MYPSRSNKSPNAMDILVLEPGTFSLMLLGG